MKRCCLLLGSVAALAFALQEVRAAPLDAEACGKLNGERLQLEFAGARNNMAKGPEWAKGNLPPDAVNQVRRLIEVDAQMLFRCNGFNLVNLSPDPDPDPDPPLAGLTKEGEDAPAKAGPKPKAKPKADKSKEKDAKAAQPPAKKPVGKQEPASGPEKSTEKKAAAKPAPKPKAKVDDAYRPPQADPNTDPFASKTKPAPK